MAKLEAKFSKLIKNIAHNEQEIREYLNDVTLAQNQSGVLVMTLLQMLIDEGVFTKEAIEERFDKNKELVLDGDGGCCAPLSTLLQDSSEGVSE